MFLFTRTDFHARLEFVILDQLFQSRGTRQPDPKLMIIGMDERSYSNLSVPITEPWPRALHAKLLNRLADAGAEKVVMDILFVDKSSNSADDEALATAIGRVPTILGAASGFGQHATINGSFFLEELLTPLDLFGSRAAGIGIVGVPETLGRVRNFLVERSEVFPDVPSLAEAASGISPAARPDKRALVNFYGPARTIPTIAYEMVLSEDHPLPPETFKGKIVFVGLNLRGRTGPSQREAFVTPFDETTFGTEVHATAASNFMNHDWINRLSPNAETLSAVIVAMLCALPIFMLTGALAGIVLGFAAILLVAWQYIFFAAGWFIPVGGAIVFGAISALLIKILANQRTHGSLRRRLF